MTVAAILSSIESNKIYSAVEEKVEKQFPGMTTRLRSKARSAADLLDSQLTQVSETITDKTTLVKQGALKRTKQVKTVIEEKQEQFKSFSLLTWILSYILAILKFVENLFVERSTTGKTEEGKKKQPTQKNASSNKPTPKKSE
jgi:hypothetical protein